MIEKLAALKGKITQKHVMGGLYTGGAILNAWSTGLHSGMSHLEHFKLIGGSLFAGILALRSFLEHPDGLNGSNPPSDPAK